MRFWLLVCFVIVAHPVLAQETQVPSSREHIQLSFAPVTKKAAPAVVNIYTKTRVVVQERQSPFANDPFFQQFFGQGFAFGGTARERVISSLGSGVLVKPDGLIVTSHHVIKDAQEITVVLSDRREFDAKVMMRDPESDLAFLKIDAQAALPYLPIKDSDTIEVGDLVLAIGNPFGVGQTVTQGIVSALARRAQGVSDYAFFIQTDAAINPGNSGGALVDVEGNLIGVNTAIYSRTGASNGIGFAIPSNMVKFLLDGKLEGGRVVRPWLGVTVQPVTSDMAQSLGMATQQGVIVRKIISGSPAERGGLRVGDVVLSVAGADITNEQDMRYRIALSRIGDNVSFKVLRKGVEQTLSIPMVAPSESPKRDLRSLSGNHPLAGVVVANLSPALADELSLGDIEKQGVIVIKTSASRLGSAIRTGDIIREVNGASVESTRQLEQLLAASTRAWKIVYERDGNLMTLTVRI